MRCPDDLVVTSYEARVSEASVIDLIFRNANVDGQGVLLDIVVDDGAILDRGNGLTYTARQEIDLNGRVVIPGFVESHLHLDIALMNSWKHPGREEPYQSHVELVKSVRRHRREFTRENIEQRASTALEMAIRHGVTAVRAQCHVNTEVGLRHLEALLTVKERYAGRITVQIVAFPDQGLLPDPQTKDLIREAFRAGADVMGCGSRHIDREGHIDAALSLAMEHDVDLDFHADLGIPERVELDDLNVVHAARRAIEVGYQGRVTAGHVCALGSALPEVAGQAIAMIKRADMNVISMPDLYRLGREDTHHVRRGLTRVKELLNAGVNVAYASNNVRDGMRPVGNLDLLEEGLILSYGAHMDTVEELNTLLRMSTYNAAKVLRLQNYGLEKGCAADLVVLDAPTCSAAIVEQAEKRYVFKAGRLLYTNVLVSESYCGRMHAASVAG